MECDAATVAEIRPFGTARSTVQEKPLSQEEIKKYDDFFKASLYLCLGMIYLMENPLLREPLKDDTDVGRAGVVHQRFARRGPGRVSRRGGARDGQTTRR